MNYVNSAQLSAKIGQRNADFNRKCARFLEMMDLDPEMFAIRVNGKIGGYRLPVDMAVYILATSYSKESYLVLKDVVGQLRTGHGLVDEIKVVLDRFDISYKVVSAKYSDEDIIVCEKHGIVIVGEYSSYPSIYWNTRFSGYTVIDMDRSIGDVIADVIEVVFG